MSKQRVPLYKSPAGSCVVETDATVGAVFGENLIWPDGRVVQVADFNPAPTAGDDLAVTLWRLVLEIPPNVTALAGTASTGLYAVTGTGSSATRAIAPGAGIEVTNGDGVAGNPTVAHADTSSVAALASDNANGVVVQDISVTFDAFGHVQTIAVGTTNLDGRYDPVGTAAAIMAAHLADADPHPQYTTTAEAAAAAPVQTVVGATGAISAAQIKAAVSYTASDVGLGNVDNTSDANKPVSTAQAAANTADRARANHTGTQVASTISDFSAAADARIGAASIDALADVAISAPAAGQIIKRNAGNTGWENGAPPAGGTTPTGTGFRRVTSGVEDAAAAYPTKADVGLANVDNTSDANKPVSTAQATANTADRARANHTGTQAASTITGLAAVATSGLKADVGLGNVDNTSDANKPVSTAQASANTADRARANHTGTQAASTITGLSAVATSGLKADVGLGNVDNTSDAAKPVSTAQATALALKLNSAGPSMTGMFRMPSSAFPRTTGFTSDTADGIGIVTAMPSGTGQVGVFEAWNKADTANGARWSAGINGLLAYINTDAFGTSGTPDLAFQTAGVTRGMLKAAGSWEFETQTTFKAGRFYSVYGTSRYLTGNAYARLQHSYYDPQDVFTLSANYDRTGNATGVIDSAALGTAEVAILAKNGAAGQVVLRAGGVNTAPTDRLTVTATGQGFNGSAPVAKPTITGSKGGNAALASLLTALASMGLITDSTT